MATAARASKHLEMSQPFRPMLKVELLGKFSVRVDGVAIDRWPRKDAAQLLKLLSVQVGHHAARHRINDALWLQVETAAKPESRLNNALYVLRKRSEER